ncbi:MAG TPA: PDZ domain-containing protein [Gammaproteobacteria bacterium]|nr:PDZ domain-containing protein [Gammaproteobacteria bacterium]
MRFAAYLAIGIAVGAGFAYWRIGGDPADDPRLGPAAEAEAPLERRLAALATELAFERYERQLLAEELADLRASLAEPEAQGDDGSDAGERFPALAGSDAQRLQALRDSTEAFRSGGNFDESVFEQRRIDRFVDAGFSPDRAQWILDREDELAMQALQARYEATQNGASAEEVAALNASQLMREELGDADYEKYLEGMGRPTSINIRDVLTNSPAEAAGIRPGDQIVAYDGRRVFDMNELTGLTYEGRPGETVAVDVIRDGQRMQLYVERGPIGVSGGGRSIRRRR